MASDHLRVVERIRVIHLRRTLQRGPPRRVRGRDADFGTPHPDEERLEWGPAWVDTGLVFTRENGTGLHPEKVTKLFAGLVEEVGLPRIPPHGLRHTSASVALANGVPLKVIADRLGHSSISITADVYSHVTEGMDREAAASIAGAISSGS